MLALSKRLSTDPWFTLPHRVTDEYIRQFALLTLETLDADQKVYVEYSNEVWNGSFSQGAWIEQQGQTEWPDSAASGFTKRINWYGKRTAEMCDIWKDIWAAESDRIVCVLSGQTANTWTSAQALACPLWTGAPCVAYGIDTLAIAPYVGAYLGKETHEAEVTGWTYDPDGGLERLFYELSVGGVLSNGPAGGALQQAANYIADNVSVAATHGLDLTAYEGGQHLVGVGNVVHNTAVTELFVSANRSPRMGTLYAEYLSLWKTLGGGLFVNFENTSQYTKWGSWGAREYLDHAGSPKEAALKDFIDQNLCWWNACAGIISYPSYPEHK
jgi:hypothetical protein